MFEAATSLPGQPIFGNVIRVSPSNEIVVVSEDVVHVVNGDALVYHSDPTQRQHRGSLKLPDVEKTKDLCEQPVGLKQARFDNAIWISNSNVAVAGYEDGDLSLQVMGVPEDVLATSLNPVVDIASILPDLWHTLPMLPVDSQHLRPVVELYPSPFSLVEQQVRRPLAGDGSLLAVGLSRLIILLENSKPVIALDAGCEITAVAVKEGTIVAGCVNGEIISWAHPSNSRQVLLSSCGSPVNLISLAEKSVVTAVGNSLCVLLGTQQIATSAIDHYLQKDKIVGVATLMPQREEQMIVVGLATGKCLMLKLDLVAHTVALHDSKSIEGRLLGITASVNKINLLTLALRRIDKQKRLEVSISQSIVPSSSLSLAMVGALTSKRSLADIYSALAESATKSVNPTQYDRIERSDDLLKVLTLSFSRLGVPSIDHVSMGKEQMLTAIIGMHFVYWSAYKLRASPGDNSILAGEAEERKSLFSEVLVKMEGGLLPCTLCQREVTLRVDSRVAVCVSGHRMPVCHNTFNPIVFDHCLRCPLCDSFFVEASVDDGRVCRVCNGCRLVSLT